MKKCVSPNTVNYARNRAPKKSFGVRTHKNQRTLGWSVINSHKRSGKRVKRNQSIQTKSGRPSIERARNGASRYTHSRAIVQGSPCEIAARSAVSAIKEIGRAAW